MANAGLGHSSVRDGPSWVFTVYCYSAGARNMVLESRLMQFFRRIGLEYIAWSLRRLHCPVSSDALVLEVGSGGNPYARANVLLDAYEVTRERHWVPLKADRPLVLGFVESLPFKDKAFDFVIASHVLEHSSDPEKFLQELQRVSKAGYIEVPDAFMERVNPYRDHRLEITCRENALIIRKKSAWVEDPSVVELYEHKAKPFFTGELMPRHPFAFHVRFYWQDKIAFHIENPEANASWPADTVERPATIVTTFRAKVQGVMLDWARRLLSQTRRNKSIRLFDLLRCPGCGSSSLSPGDGEIGCQGCGAVYPIKNGMPVMYPKQDAG